MKNIFTDFAMNCSNSVVVKIYPKSPFPRYSLTKQEARSLHILHEDYFYSFYGLWSNMNISTGDRSTLPRTSANCRTGSRPTSFYDNFRENASTAFGTLNKLKSKSDQNNSQTFQRQSQRPGGFPTQLFCLNTTVPQNIAAENVAERHTPTRNSLRHSRMIVMSRMAKEVPKKSLPPILRSHKLAKILLALQIVLGTSLFFMGMWLLIWSSSLRTRDNPYWSGTPLLFSGIIGLILLYSCRKEYPGMSKSCCTFSLKVLSLTISSAASICCFTSCAFALIHVISLAAMKCELVMTESLKDTCKCTIYKEYEYITMPIKSFHYEDLQCTELDLLKILLILSCILSLLGGMISSWYLYLHWSSRYAYTYSKVRTKEEQPIVLSNV